MSDSALDELRTAYADLRRAAVRAERAAADIVEEIDPSFPTWFTATAPSDPSPELETALCALDAVVAVRHTIAHLSDAMARIHLQRKDVS